MNAAQPGAALRPVRPCPICGAPAADRRAFPFCSSRCADIDLHRWLSGVYAIPASSADEAAEEAAADEAER